MSEKTEQNLAQAFAAESRAAARNSAFAQKADHDGQPQIGRLFRALADSESIQARRYLMLLRGKISATPDNLEAAYRDILKAYEEEYPRIIREAGDEGLKTAESSFSQSRDVKTTLMALIKKGLNHELSEVDLDYYVCQICGFTNPSRVPEKCPVCGAIPGKFKLVG